MLRDVTFKKHLDPVMAMILAGVSNDRGLDITHIDTGIYLCGHWNFHDIVVDKFDDLCYFGNDYDQGNYIGVYGVCDNYQQVINKCPLLLEENHDYCISLVPVFRNKQPEQGGWRYHKWGDYIGNQNPQHEYLYHDKHIDLVYTYHIYRFSQTRMTNQQVMKLPGC